MTVKYSEQLTITKLARNHLNRMRPAGAQIAQAQICNALLSLGRNHERDRWARERSYLPVELTDIDPQSYGKNWAGISMIRRGRNAQGSQVIHIDLVIQGPQWSYQDGEYLFPANFPQSILANIRSDPEKYLGLSEKDGFEVNNIAVDLEGNTRIGVFSPISYYNMEDLGSQNTNRIWNADSIATSARKNISDRLWNVVEAYGEHGQALEHALHSYHAMSEWIFESNQPQPFLLENFPISRDWLVTPRGGNRLRSNESNALLIDIKRAYDSNPSEHTAAARAKLEMRELGLDASS